MFIIDNDIHFVAHRGYSSVYYDNTIEAITACNELGCLEGIECDVHLTKDNKLVLLHNDLIGLKHVQDYTFDELCQIPELRSRLSTRPMLLKGYNIQDNLVNMRAGNNLFKRRSGKEYYKIQKNLFKIMKEKKYISSFQYDKSITIRTLSAFAPNFIRKNLFKRLLRRKK